MAKRLFVTPYRCIDCKTCQEACNYAHDRNPFDSTHSRIHTNVLGDGSRSIIVCLQCGEAACAAICPHDALVRNTETGAIERTNDCVGCLLCVKACPFGNMDYDPIHHEVIKCDLCGGDPNCAKHCPTGALVWADEAMTEEEAEEKYKRFQEGIPAHQA